MKAINDAGRSLTRYELVDAVERQGLKIGGTDKPRNMGTILWRSGHFINSGGGYWPKEATHPDSMFQGEDGGEQSIL